MKREIIRKLYELNPVEKIQRKTGRFIEDMPAGAISMQEETGRTLNTYFFRNREIYLRRHIRFTGIRFLKSATCCGDLLTRPSTEITSTLTRGT